MKPEEKEPIKKFIEQIEEFCNDSYCSADEIRKKGQEYVDGLAVYYFGRCVSCFMGIKTNIYALDLAGSDKNFADNYINKILPSKFPYKDVKLAQQYIKETHMVNRFALFQNFYSQTEFTYRIIQREKHADEALANPFRLIAEKYGIMSADFVKFINAIRNTIHNNGYYFPLDKTPELKYEFNGKTFHFIYGNPIDAVSMMDIFAVITFLLSENKKLFYNDDLAKIKFK